MKIRCTSECNHGGENSLRETSLLGYERRNGLLKEKTKGQKGERRTRQKGEGEGERYEGKDFRPGGAFCRANEEMTLLKGNYLGGVDGGRSQGMEKEVRARRG